MLKSLGELLLIAFYILAGLIAVAIVIILVLTCA